MKYVLTMGVPGEEVQIRQTVADQETAQRIVYARNSAEIRFNSEIRWGYHEEPETAAP